MTQTITPCSRQLLGCIRYSITLFFLVVLSACNEVTPPDVDSPRVLVVGAGTSGLASAKALTEAGISVTVLEARDRIGGRTWSHVTDSAATLDLGASWIHGSHPKFEALVADLNLEMVNTQYRDLMLHNSSKEAYPLDSAVADDLEETLTYGMVLANLFYGKSSVQDVVDDLWRRSWFGNHSLELIQFLVTASVDTLYAASSEDISVRAFLEGLGSTKDDVGDRNLAFPGGYNQVTDFLAEDLDIQLETQVTHIDYQSDPIVVTTTKGEFETDLVIVTVPIGVLQSDSISFSPALPKWKHQSINRLGSGVLNKLYLEFPHAFWEDTDMIGISRPEKGGLALWVNMEKVTKRPILMAFSSGRSAIEIESLSDEKIIDKGMFRLRQAYGDNIPSPIGHTITRWHSDPFARGSYSFYSLNTKMGDRAKLSILFAGEATSQTDNGLVPGAYMTGLREAQRIIDWYAK